jgi:hypothetical protein
VNNLNLFDALHEFLPAGRNTEWRAAENRFSRGRPSGIALTSFARRQVDTKSCDHFVKSLNGLVATAGRRE